MGLPQGGQKLAALQYSIPTSRIKCPLDEIRRVKDELSAPPVVDYNAMDGDHTLLEAGTNLREKLGLMMAARKGNLYPDLWVRLCLGVTSCPPPTWRYGPWKSML